MALATHTRPHESRGYGLNSARGNKDKEILHACLSYDAAGL